ncbi:gamma-aminobutyric acid receptor subunit beta-like [Eurytemora carolleeae]|uniref:gamma-aminobutyric acid receptor subunit beta-like n=1 Tax=Eurytemora carolleeae TaxID=1294199 RepID=UPI000C771497|nr:gamma-aminobutyric acid receptor subunit beta-like [Eurytemora carolleeae]|eukprot:XP_023338885.1 gamma-aminobutyric acid receptor subunit beta-like [Eurytemora affinis]
MLPSAASLDNVTKTIGRLLDGYDIRLRPNFGGDPLYVGFDLTIASFDSISEVSMDYTGITCEHKGITCENKGIAWENKGIAWESKGIACKNKGIAWENKGIARENKGKACEHKGIAWESKGIAWENKGIAWENKGIAWENKGITWENKVKTCINKGIAWESKGIACKNKEIAWENKGITWENKVLTLSGDFAEKIWVPDTFFANDKKSFLHDVTEQNKMVRLHGDGAITYGMRFTTTLACMMDLHHYPLDRQNCTVEIESYGYTVSDVVMYWREEPVVGVEDAELPQFTIMGWETNERKIKLATGTYQRLSLSFKLQRNIGYFVFQTYLPSILIVMLSWVSFWINHEATSARVALGITTVLTMTTISTGVRSSLPRISYVKAIDIYLVMCFVFVFAALLEYAAVNYTYWGARAKKKKKEKKQKDKDKKEKLMNNIVKKISGSEQFPPSFRMHRNYSFPTRGSTNHVYRKERRRTRLLNQLRKGAVVIKSSLPKIQDVNVIDKYSRVVFPVSFILFNVMYWCFYVLQV